MYRKLSFLLAVVLLAQLCSAQVSAGAFSLKKLDAPKDTTKPAAAKTKIKPYKEIIPNSGTTTMRGLIIVHKVEDKYFFEIPDALLGKDILTVTRLSRSSAGFRGGMFGYAGDEINENVIRFEKGPGNKIFIRTISYLDYSKDSSSPMYRAVTNSNVQPIAATFDIKAFAPDGKASVVDMTDFISGDNELLYFDSRSKMSLKLGSLATDKSYIDTVRSYPMNVEIRTVKTYPRTSATNATLEINASIILLPEKPMKPREYDKRVGFFAGGFYNYDADPQGVKATYYVRRWRLEPREEDREKYKRGQLVEPAKPIIIYIDPATPEKWVPYLIQGVNDWQAAFEKAGFKNAIQARRAPSKKEDSTWSIEDARYSAIVYKPSPVANASGPHVADPRTGEILETHINWYHNVMKLLQSWYFIQCAAVDPRARKMDLDDELMGQLIRFVSSHEVGHTLGLRHNFGSSSTVPVENLRNKKWVEEHGHTPSIMDYARFNYVAQPEDHISEKGLFPRIGDYDKWAIEWGYKWLPQFNEPKAEQAYLNQVTIEKLKDQRLWFGTESDPTDPRAQSEDLGDNAMKAGAYGIKNLQVITRHLNEWTKVPNEGYGHLAAMYNEVVDQYTRYLFHAVKNLGGVYTTFKTVEQPGTQLAPVPAATQKEALAFLKDYLFTTPAWLLDNNIMNNTGKRPTDLVTSIQAPILDRLVNGFMMERLVQVEAMEGDKAYKLQDYFKDLAATVGIDSMETKATDIYQRNLQKLYVEKYNQMLNPKIKKGSEITSLDLNDLFPQGLAIRNTDVYATIKGHLLDLQTAFKAAFARATDPTLKNHFRYLSDRITEILEPKGDNIY